MNFSQIEPNIIIVLEKQDRSELIYVDFSLLFTSPIQKIITATGENSSPRQSTSHQSKLQTLYCTYELTG